MSERHDTTILRPTLAATAAFVAVFSTVLIGTTPGADVVLAGVGVLVPFIASMIRLSRGESARAVGWAAGLAAAFAIGLGFYLFMPRMGVPKAVLLLNLYPVRAALALIFWGASVWLWWSARRWGMALDRKQYWIGVAMAVLWILAWSAGVAWFAARPPLF